MSYQTGVYIEQGGDKLVVGFGGEIEVRPGGTVDLQQGATLSMANGYTANGHGMLRLARFTYDFAVHGGDIGARSIGTMPNKAIIVGGFVDVITTCQTEGADAGTMAISVEAADDIVAAVAVNSANPGPWDAGLQAIKPKADAPETTAVKCTAQREVVATIAGQKFTAGKFVLFLYYVMSE